MEQPFDKGYLKPEHFAEASINPTFKKIVKWKLKNHLLSVLYLTSLGLFSKNKSENFILLQMKSL